MVSAIGSSSFPNPAGAGAAAGLEAQLARYQKVLSECVSCDSAKTREGKQAIQDISSKIGEVKARIEKITSTRSDIQPDKLNVKTLAGISGNGDALVSGVPGNAAGAIGHALGSVTAPLGNRLDVFA